MNVRQGVRPLLSCGFRPFFLLTANLMSVGGITDRLVTREGEVARWSDPRIDSPHSHGTGCILSSAIATLAHEAPKGSVSSPSCWLAFPR